MKISLMSYTKWKVMLDLDPCHEMLTMYALIRRLSLDDEDEDDIYFIIWTTTTRGTTSTRGRSCTQRVEWHYSRAYVFIVQMILKFSYDVDEDSDICPGGLLIRLFCSTRTTCVTDEAAAYC